MTVYDDAFYKALEDTAGPSARVILPMLLQEVAVSSAVDIGCGDGSWLAALRASGVKDILGVDGPWRSTDLLKIPAENFRRAPLDQPLDLNRRFDLAISLEVAEHLPPERAAGFIDELVALAPVVLFSAAIPGQGGVNHINEQWPAYWAELFDRKGFAPIDMFRHAIWNNDRVAWWYKQNLVLYVDRSLLSHHPRLATRAITPPDLLPLIHPEPWNRLNRLSQPRIGRWIRMAPAVLRRTFTQR